MPASSTPSHAIISGARRLALLGATGLLAAAAAHAQASLPAPGIDASGSYRQERAACIGGMTPQSQATCLEEARNAAADKRRGALAGDERTDLAANRLQRCEVFQDQEDRAACVARVEGRGELEGSVGQGGVVRAVETIVVPAGASRVQIDPVSADPVILVPAARAAVY